MSTGSCGKGLCEPLKWKSAGTPVHTAALFLVIGRWNVVSNSLSFVAPYSHLSSTAVSVILVPGQNILVGYGEDRNCPESFNLQSSEDGKSVVEGVDCMDSLVLGHKVREIELLLFQWYIMMFVYIMIPSVLINSTPHLLNQPEKTLNCLHEQLCSGCKWCYKESWFSLRMCCLFSFWRS